MITFSFIIGNNLITINYSTYTIITAKIINRGKITYLSTFKELEDSIYSMMSLYVSKEYLDLDLLEERKKEIEKVTKEDIIKFSKKIHMDTIYLLEGEA